MCFPPHHRLSPTVSWDWLQLTSTLKDGQSFYLKTYLQLGCILLMNACIFKKYIFLDFHIWPHSDRVNVTRHPPLPPQVNSQLVGNAEMSPLPAPTAKRYPGEQPGVCLKPQFCSIFNLIKKSVDQEKLLLNKPKLWCSHSLCLCGQRAANILLHTEHWHNSISLSVLLTFSLTGRLMPYSRQISPPTHKNSVAENYCRKIIKRNTRRKTQRSLKV